MKLGLFHDKFSLQQENLSSHKVLYIKQLLMRELIVVLEHFPNSSDLALCDFFLFPVKNNHLKGSHF
jgi:hypothetical protein